jgi:EmrB/QacA subfamily drug resistance transporter
VSTPLWGKLGDLHGRKIYFQAAIAIFVIGSVLCGLAGSMTALIIFRAIQGLGGGGLLVGAQAIIGDIVAPRERGRYSGWFGATFGAATVLGPLLGGVIVEYWSWRWVFYVNVPLGALALIVTAVALPSSTKRSSHRIDYAGTAALSMSASALILFTSLGGTNWAWGSTPSVTLVAVGVVGAVVFWFIEKRASEPILAPRLFKNRVFTSASAIGFVVGFAMFGAMTYLPLFMQLVKGVSPTVSGLRLLPMMVGIFGASIGAGQLVARGWRYRGFPIAGCSVTVLGLGLLATVSTSTSSYLMGLYMFILGFGLGLVMQILVTAVQNAVPFSDLGGHRGSQLLSFDGREFRHGGVRSALRQHLARTRRALHGGPRVSRCLAGSQRLDADDPARTRPHGSSHRGGVDRCLDSADLPVGDSLRGSRVVAVADVARNHPAGNIERS